MPVADVEADWREGGTIRWRGELGAHAYEVSGTVFRYEPGVAFGYRYTDPISRTARVVTVELESDGAGTLVTVSERGSANERQRAHAEGGWRLMLANLRALLEEPRDQRSVM